MDDTKKLSQEVQKAIESGKMICPNCNREIHLSYVAKIPERQVMHMKLTSGTGAWSAKTIGNTIVNFDKLLKAVARDVGGKVEVFIDSIKHEGKDLDVGFLIVSVTDSPSEKRGTNPELVGRR